MGRPSFTAALLVLSSIRSDAARFRTAVTTEEKSRMQQFYSPTFFRQKLDHFRPQDERAFDQRYYTNMNAFNMNGGPVFLYIGGEAPLYGPPSGEVEELAREFGAAVVALEHRYYGKSAPFDQSTTENLKYLNTGQAMLDLVAFREFFSEELKKMGATGNHKWVAFGGSYAGGLAAWMRAFFPQYVDGAIASSGVVELVLAFDTFDKQVALASGADCARVMSSLFVAMEQLLEDPNSNARIKQKFNAQALSDGDFRYMTADAASMAVQYGYKDRLCAPMLTAYQTSNGDLETLLDAFASYAATNFFTTLETGNANEYSTAYLQQTEVSEDKSARTWLYQTCTELGWFQVAPKEQPMRSPKLGLEYFKGHCRDVFGKDLWPDTEAGNKNTGGKDIRGSHIYFVNGGMDPWQHVSVTKPAVEKDVSAAVLDCEGCAHCRDLKGSAFDDPPALTNARQDIRMHIMQWLQ